MDATTPRKAHDTALTPADHPRVAAEKVGVLLVNLGTPDAPTAEAVRRYLAEFLSDPRVVDYPRFLWMPILHGIILNVRPARAAHGYAKVWRAADDESPLRAFTRLQAEGLAGALGPAARVDWAMRYGAPSISSRIEALAAEGARRILVVPLYPQYSATTTASVHDAAFAAVARLRWQPALRVAPAFHDDPNYIEALAAVLKRRLAALAAPPERVVLSFHGLPERFLTEGDPYHCHCQKTARLLRERMGWSAEFAPTTFQSRFGREKWLGPATDETIEALARSGVKRIAVATPGFLADCLETLEEIAIAGREAFIEAGGESFEAIPCLNDAPEAIAMLEALVRREAAGWIASSA